MEMINTASTVKPSKVYDLRIIAVSHQTIIMKSDLENLDVLARYVIATELWNKCTECARQALLSAQVPLISEAAQLSQATETAQSMTATVRLN
ncbi:hypothetical protein SAMN04244572_04438 [Azotobacter beijerinckii]|uniref:Uncharacterized protein n=1 Tax=Azotobacter beijerinckii TaxID=170623 RepID=A0A1H6ZS57_9GAMM|nr:hypothetical protein [Azotobacter beijerinckii]SEJ55004.1 hypothetical protein SAMN04244572_04438 [Azotobacter beijerinckii]